MSIRSAMLATSLLTVSQVTAGEPVTLQFEEPSLDRWNYPFNQTNGVKPIASVFGAFEEDGLSPLFDNRDAQFLVGFSTAEDVPPGLGPQSYFISAAALTVMVAGHNSFQYETELQPWRNFVPPNVAVPPLELYGAGFRNGFTPVTYQENSSYSPMGPFGKGHRTAYPIDRDFSEGPVDVSNNVDLGFDPWPLSIGTTTAAAPGELVPQGAVFTFELDTADPHVQAYLREAVDHGIVHFMIASLFPAAEDGSGLYPEFYTRENLLVQAGLAQAAQLSITIQIVGEPAPGDLNNDNAVDVSDLLILLAAWGECPEAGACAPDLNGDGAVDVLDMLALLSNWG